MSPLSVAAHIAQCLEALRTGPETPTVAGLAQSLTAWLSYVRVLERVRGRANPATAAVMHTQFAPLATALLDQVADTFCRVFALPWPPAERTHTQLTQAFPALCSAHRWQGDTAGLHAVMRELHARLMLPGTPRTARGTPRAAGGATPIPPADLPEVGACLNQYLVAMLQFFAQNHA